MDARPPTRALALITLAAVAWHGGWALTVPQPIDWDPAYYLDVARSIAAGAGAVSGAMWHWSGPSLPLPMPADLHWMPLPSRVLVPFVWALGTVGATACAVLLAAAWVPLAGTLARTLGGSRREVLGAAVLAGFGGGYVRFLSTPDSIGLYGVLGGLAWLVASHGAVARTALLAALLALTRGDGFLMAPALGLVLWLQGRRAGGLSVAVVGPLAWAVWMGRCVVVGGPEWWTARQQTSGALHIHDLLLGRASDPSMVDRLGALGGGVQDAATTAILVGVMLLPVLALIGGASRVRRPLVQGLALYAGCMVVVPSTLAPGVAASGSFFRSGAALFPAACALAALASAWLGDVGHRHRGYPRALVPALVGVGFGAGSLAMAWTTWHARPAPPVVCLQPAAGQVVLSGHPLLVRATCGVSAVALFRGGSADKVALRAREQGAFVAWLPALDTDPLAPTRADAPELLPGWREWEPGLWVHPDAPSPTVPPTGW